MGLTVVAAAACLASKQRQLTRGAPLSAARPCGERDELALDYARSASTRALERAGIAPGELGLLISKGISPTHVAESPEIMGPRLCHPLQHALTADHAFVFDMVEADWASMLDTAEIMLASLERRYALLVHSELSSPSIAPDASSGFALSDGAGVLVVARDELPFGKASYAPIRAESARLAMLEGAETQSDDRPWAQLSWRGDLRLAQAVSEAMRSAILEQLDAQRTRAGCALAVERWFDEHEPAQLPAQLQHLPPTAALGALTIPYATELHAAGGCPGPMLMACVDPFRGRASCRAVQLGAPA